MGFESYCPVVRAVQDRKQTFHQPDVVARLCSCTPQQIVISVVVQIWCGRINIDLNVGFSSVVSRFRSFFHSLFLLFFLFHCSLIVLSLFVIFPFPPFRSLFVFIFISRPAFIMKTFSQTKCLFLTQQQGRFPAHSVC